MIVVFGSVPGVIGMFCWRWCFHDHANAY